MCLNKILFLSVFLLFVRSAKSQDIHYSQLRHSPLNISPSNSGLINSDFRIILNHRTQWKSITTPYLTTTFSADALKKNILHNLNLGYGLLINKDKAGDTEFGTTQLHIPLAVHIILGKDSTTMLNVGTDFAYAHFNINYSALKLGSQFDGEKYNPNIVGGEEFMYDNINFFDLALGFSVLQKIKDLKIIAGLGLWHANQNVLSFNNDKTAEIKARKHLFLHLEIPINNFVVQPSFMFSKQSNHNEYMSGTRFSAKCKSNRIKEIHLALWYRNKDAVITEIGVSTANLKLSLSYDFNVSDLQNVSNNRGGVELSAIYLLNKAKIIYPKTHSCPAFL